MKRINFNLILNILLVGVIGVYIGKWIYTQPKFINGEVAPNFRASLLNGQPFELTDLRGKFVLIDFWGSWCAPCRRENPNLVKIYQDFKDQSFEIVSIGVEREESRWRSAIRKDDLRWPYHILDRSTNMKFFNSEIAKLYGVTQLPTIYLLYTKGKIVAVNPSTSEIRQFLEQSSIATK